MDLKDVYKHWRTTYERIEKFISKDHFADANLLARLVTHQASPIRLQHLKSHEFEGPRLDKSIQDADHLWEDVEIGFEFGPVWSVHWFRVQLPRPQWLTSNGDNCHSSDIHFRWNSGTEALIFLPSGDILQGVTSLHDGTRETAALTLSELESAGDTLYLQCSVSELFGAGPSCVLAPDSGRCGTLAACQLIRREPRVSRLLEDLQLLMELAKELKETERGHQALYCANSIVNLCLKLRYDEAIGEADAFFGPGNAGSAGRLKLHAMGHCHIDTAWLWNYAETRRKTARSWATTLRLMRQNADMTFVVSQAQQLSWLQTDYPDLFAEIVDLASKGRFIPVGGSWVEMDTNLPCCESLLRQFHYGQAFFRQHFGRHCPEFWLPDTFGYSGQLPQLMKHAGMRWFLTQKLSWSLVNKFPHHSFVWRGIDDTEVLAHFPPGDSYCMQVRPSELAFSAANHRDKGRASHAAFLYGHGDGGQGPGRDMLARLSRLSDCEGLPKLSHGTPQSLFAGLEADKRNLHAWTGELYLELHNGTYTTHRGVKLANFRCESALRVTELLLSVESLRCPMNAKTRQSLDTAWQLLLLNQFHDVIPGSSIGRVYVDAMRHYDEVMSFCRDVCQPSTNDKLALVNPTQWPLSLTLPDHPERVLELPPFSTSSLDRLLDVASNHAPASCVASNDDGSVTLENAQLRARIDSSGRVTSLISKSLSPGEQHRECLSAPVQLTHYHDVPLYWDAWDIMDYSWETRGEVAGSSGDGEAPMGRVLEPCRVVGPYSCVTVYELTSYPLQSSSQEADSQQLVSRIEHEVSLLPDRPGCLTFCTRLRPWRAAHTLLRVELPCSVRGVTKVACEIQAGRVDRATRGNTSWDWAAHEHCSHRYVDLSESGFGMAVLKHAIYGASVRDGSTVHLSLLRSPRGPDPGADFNAEHSLRYALMPHSGSGVSGIDVTRAACQFGYQCEPELLRTATCLSSGEPFVTLEQDGSRSVVLDWVKPAADAPAPSSSDNNDAFVVRLYESLGGYVSSCRLRIRGGSGFGFGAAFESNALEERLRPLNVAFPVVTGGDAVVSLAGPIAAYQIVSVLICRQV